MQCAWIILKTSPHPNCPEKLSSTKPAPGAKKVGDGWYKVCSSKKVKPAFTEGISPNCQVSGNTGGWRTNHSERKQTRKSFMKICSAGQASELCRQAKIWKRQVTRSTEGQGGKQCHALLDGDNVTVSKKGHLANFTRTKVLLLVTYSLDMFAQVFHSKLSIATLFRVVNSWKQSTYPPIQYNTV